MSTTRTKIRSLVLAVLLVTSVFAGSVAFSGTVAAAGNTTFSVGDNTAGADTTYTTEADVESSGTLETIEFDTDGGVQNLDSVSSGDITVEVDGSSASVDSVSASGDTLTVTLSSTQSVSVGTTISADFELTNADTVGTYSGEIRYVDDGDSEIDSFSSDYTIQNANRERLDEADEPLTSGDVFWQGQELFFKVPGGGNAEYTLRTADDTDSGAQIGDFVQDVSLDENGEYVLETGEADGGMEGRYVIEDTNEAYNFDSDGVATGSGGSASFIDDAAFEVREQTFSASFEESSVESDTATLNLDSNRGGYDVNITAEGLDADELISIFETSDQFDPTEIDDDEIQVTTSSEDVSTELNFSDVDAQEYTFQFAVADTGVHDDANITRVEGEDASASFRDNNIIEVGEGDVAEIPIEVDDTDQVTVNIGSNDKGFVESVTLEDDNGDGEVGLRMNTYLAGRDMAEPLDAYETMDDDDNIISGQFTRHTDPISDPPLDATFYNLNLTVGDSEKAVGTLSITDRRTNGLVSWTMPENQFDEAENPAELTAAMNDGLITQQSDIAYRDGMVVEIDSTSILGALDAAQDGSDSEEEAFVDMVRGEGEIEPGAFAFSIRQHDPPANQGPKFLDLDETEATGGINVIPDQENGTLYVELSTRDVRMVRADNLNEASNSDGTLGFGTGQDYTANFTFGENSGMVDESVVVESDFSIVEREIEFDTADDGRVHVYPAPGQLITGNATVAPGTELNLRLRRTGTRGSFLLTPNPVVEPDGSFESTVDFSDQAGNLTFDIEARGFDDLSLEGYILPRQTASANMSDQTIRPGESVLIEDVTLSEGGFVALYRGSRTGEIIGSSDYIQPENETDVRIPVSVAGSSVTLVAVPHLDDDGNREFNAAFDPPYENNGTVVTLEAEMTFLTPTPTATPTPPPTLTATPRPTKTDSPTPTATLTPINTTARNASEQTTTSGPGFTAALALVALAAAAMLIARRRD